jgi:hypothetical protein
MIRAAGRRLDKPVVNSNQLSLTGRDRGRRFSGERAVDVVRMVRTTPVLHGPGWPTACTGLGAVVDPPPA